MKSIILDFVRFVPPHTGEATAALLHGIMEKWNLTHKISSITTDNASDVCTGISVLHERLFAKGSKQRNLREFHIRCIAHVINFAVKKCLTLINEDLSSI